MNRTVTLTIVVAVLVAAAFLLGRGVRDSSSGETRRGADSVWYHASDVAQLARTGRPQLVEFFHPG